MSRYIDADKAKEILGTVRCAYNCFDDNERTHYEVLSRTIEMIDEMPTADVRENVRGEWIEDNPRDKSMMWRCSVCGRIAYYPTIGERKSYKKHCGYNFCPNCGADMRTAGSEHHSILAEGGKQ